MRRGVEVVVGGRREQGGDGGRAEEGFEGLAFGFESGCVSWRQRAV